VFSPVPPSSLHPPWNVTFPIGFKIADFSSYRRETVAIVSQPIQEVQFDGISHSASNGWSRSET
jgi:hypothetical protein